MAHLATLNWGTQRSPDKHSNGLMGAPWMRPQRAWIVKTESNVKREKKKLPDPPCVICHGTGKVKCTRCAGRGRTNFTELAMLPKGEWPKWRKTWGAEPVEPLAHSLRGGGAVTCWDCSGSGRSFCQRCFGTGEKRGIIGFHVSEEKMTGPHSSTEN